MTTNTTNGSTAHQVGTPPPFAPELVPIVNMIARVRPPDAYRPDNIQEMRAPVPGVETPTDEVLPRGGPYLVEERRVPGPDGQPDITLLICLPQSAPAL